MEAKEGKIFPLLSSLSVTRQKCYTVLEIYRWRGRGRERMPVAHAAKFSPSFLPVLLLSVLFPPSAQKAKKIDEGGENAHLRAGQRKYIDA